MSDERKRKICKPAAGGSVTLKPGKHKPGNEAINNVEKTNTAKTPSRKN